MKRWIAIALISAIAGASALPAEPVLAQSVLAEEPSAQASPPVPTSGTLAGILTAKERTWIEVRADGESEAKRYTPRWIGGLPKDGGGLDKEMLSAIDKLRVGNRVRLDWKWEERLRVTRVETLRPTQESGRVIGIVTAKGENWIEVRPLEGGDVERYSPRWIGGMPKDGGGLDKDILRALANIKVGDHVRLDWIYNERKRVVEIHRVED